MQVFSRVALWNKVKRSGYCYPERKRSISLLVSNLEEMLRSAQQVHGPSGSPISVARPLGIAVSNGLRK
jgi:hypothetical protein